MPNRRMCDGDAGGSRTHKDRRFELPRFASLRTRSQVERNSFRSDERNEFRSTKVAGPGVAPGRSGL